MRVRVLHTECDLRVGFDESRPELFKILESVLIVLEFFDARADLPCLLQDGQGVNEVELAERHGSIA